MKIFADRAVKYLFLGILGIMAVFILLSQLAIWSMNMNQIFSLTLLILSVTAFCAVAVLCFIYFSRQNKIMEEAAAQINNYLSGNTSARIDCDREGEMYRLFHSVNTMAAILNAHAEKELQAKEFLKGTISDISHQLKTPIAALNIYNGLLQEEVDEFSDVRKFASLSEKELDRMEVLVQNLLKITKLDSGSMVMEKEWENVADMMDDIMRQFAYRAEQEHKELIFSGDGEVRLFCDRGWLVEAIDNMVKNALDHTKEGDTVSVEWKQLTSIVQVVVKDNGSGIHPEDIHHIFKRFYRSRFSMDVQGIGLGLPLAKAVIEAHNGTIEVDSELGAGTVFVINFLIPTKL